MKPFFDKYLVDISKYNINIGRDHCESVIRIYYSETKQTSKLEKTVVQVTSLGQ